MDAVLQSRAQIKCAKPTSYCLISNITFSELSQKIWIFIESVIEHNLLVIKFDVLCTFYVRCTLTEKIMQTEEQRLFTVILRYFHINNSYIFWNIYKHVAD